MEQANVVQLPVTGLVDLRAQVEGLLRGGVTQSTVARQSGVSATALNRWLKGKYEGDNEAIERSVRAWLQAYEERAGLRLPDAPPWIATETATQIADFLSFAQNLQTIVPIYGVPGVGKTRTAQHYAASHPNTWIATMSPDTQSPWAAMEELAISTGLREIGGGAARVRREIVNRLQGTRGLIVIDEAQHLSVAALESLRRIYDTAQVGLVLMGNETVYARLTGGSRSADFARLYSRVGCRLRIDGVQRGDIEAIAAAWGVKGGDTLNELVEIGEREGRLRTVTNVLRLSSMHAARSGEQRGNIAHDHVQRAWRAIGGDR